MIGVTAFNRFLRGDWQRRMDAMSFQLHISLTILIHLPADRSAANAAIGTDFDGGLGLRTLPRVLTAWRFTVNWY